MAENALEKAKKHEKWLKNAKKSPKNAKNGQNCSKMLNKPE